MPFDPAKPTLLSTLVRHYEELVDHVRRRFGDRGMAREVVHDVCVQLLERDEKENVHTPPGPAAENLPRHRREPLS